MANDLIFAELRKLKDGNGRPLWQDSAQAGQPARGFPVVPDSHLASSMTASADRVTSEYAGIKEALKIVGELSGRTTANGIGPLALKQFGSERLIRAGAVDTSTSRLAGFADASNGRLRTNWSARTCITG